MHPQTVEDMRRQLKRNGIKKIIAISGSVPSSDYESWAERQVAESFEVLQDLPIAIQTGGTEFDIQKYAAERARKLGMPLIGVFPQKGNKYRMKGLDFAIQVDPRLDESQWGDDSEVFTKIPNGVEMIAGGVGTLIELGHFMAINKDRIKKRKRPIYIAPVMLAEEVTTANYASNFPTEARFRRSFPDYAIYSGAIAADFLVRKLRLKK